MAGVVQTLTPPVAAKDDRNLGIAVKRPAANSPMSDEFLTMHRVRQVGWVGLAVFGTVGVAGLVLSVASAVAAGDWDLAPMPWIGIGMTLLVAGLAGGACFAVLLDVVEPIGWWRLLAIPPALVIGGFWALVLIFGLPTTGGPDFDVATVLYSLPVVTAVLVVATVALALPAVAGRPRIAR